MLTAKQALKLVTHSVTPPWRISELQSAFKGSSPFSLKLALEGLDQQTCVLFVGVRDASLVKSSATFAELQAKWNSSTPSRNTLVSLQNFLENQGASLNWLSSDWKTAAIVSPVSGLSDIRVSVLDPTSWGQATNQAGQMVGLIGKIMGSNELTWWGAATQLLSTLVDEVLNNNLGSPTSGDTGSSAGGDTGGGSGSGGDVLQIPEVTIYGQVPQGVDPSTILNVGTFTISAGPSDDDDDDDDDGDGGGGGGG